MVKGYRRPHKFKRKKPIFRSRFFWLGILGLMIAGGISYFLFFSEVFQVEKVIIPAGEKIPTEELRLFIGNKLETKILFFRTKSIFLVNINEIKKDILNNFPQLSQIEIKRQFPDTLNTGLVKRKGLAVWCQEDNCFLLDKEGVIFEKVLPETSLIKIRDDEKGTSPFNLGNKVIEKDYLDSILKIQEKLKNTIQIEIEEFIFLNDRLTIKTLEGWEIYLNLKGDIDWQLTKLSAVLKEKIPPEKRKDLEYIELRFGNLAPYKYK